MASEPHMVLTFDAERFEKELLKRLALSSAFDSDAVIAEMVEDVMRYVCIGDILDAEILEDYK